MALSKILQLYSLFEGYEVTLTEPSWNYLHNPKKQNSCGFAGDICNCITKQISMTVFWCSTVFIARTKSSPKYFCFTARRTQLLFTFRSWICPIHLIQEKGKKTMQVSNTKLETSQQYCRYSNSD